jgi:hypothetical protein
MLAQVFAQIGHCGILPASLRFFYLRQEPANNLRILLPILWIERAFERQLISLPLTFGQKLFT